MRGEATWWETESFAFIRVPKAILTNPYYTGLSSTGALLYGLLLDRMNLSIKNRASFMDRFGCVFVYFTLKETGEVLSCGHDKATKLFRELEMFDLITRIKQGKGRPVRIYVNKFKNDKNT